MKTESTTQSNRQHILDVGYQLIAAKGFSCVGLAQLLQASAVPKGSFYHYFKSKEQFGEALIQGYFEGYKSDLDTLFGNTSLNGYDRLMTYWQRWLTAQIEGCIDQKCLVVKLSAEVADLSEAMRLALLNGSASVIHRLTVCIAVGVEDGSIAKRDPQSTAEMLYHMWLGASLMNKLGHPSDALNRAIETTKLVLRP
ncbi:TetR/AcrR family transcriptional regulator [Shewanella sp. VB17]|uniref:TetR/AcrR family transcriptional regulator n=1 Tax=Shewanella sp. VB17 TaxID=2739432 RepID=UPI001563848C|nr:TetR/AcrR family transcriptional regulator [Shewanella sp. VB17]NRD72215.1 TetR/AcrR family transcriptional regulator [Shewanella sp. VB17]